MVLLQRRGLETTRMTMTAHRPTDVAEAILQHLKALGVDRSAKKVQKVTYYAHAIHRARVGRPLVTGWQAWQHGPVIQAIYDRQRGDAAPTTLNGNPDALDNDAAESVRLAVELYGDIEGRALIQLSHEDGPWRAARGDLPDDASSREPITDEMIDEYLVPKIRPLLAAAASPAITIDQLKARHGLV
jgi:uncharacterized phage-associated protein